MKIEIVGSYPPPIGGIATHVSRLLPYLEKENIPFHVYNRGSTKAKNVTPICKSKLWFIKYLITKNQNVIHFHETLKGFEYIYWYLFSRLNTSKIIITLHNEYLLSINKLYKMFFLTLLRNTHYLELLVVSDKVALLLKSNNINHRYLPAYVPFQKTIKHISLVDNDNRGYFVFSCYRITKKNAFDVYGFDLAVNILKFFKNDLRMLLLIGDKKESDITFLMDYIQKNEVGDDIKIIYNSKLTSYVRNGLFFLRANRKDGYGVSLQEALDLGVISIGSDICRRPKGTILFKSNNLDDLKNKVEYVLKLDINHKNKLLNKRENTRYHKVLIDIYKKYLLKNGE